VLERDQAFNFIGMTLEIKEKTLAQEEGREAKEIKEDDVEEVFAECDIDHDGNISKDEMKAWLHKYMNAKPEKKEQIIGLVRKKTMSQKDKPAETAK